MRVLHFCERFSPLSQTFIYDYVTELERQGVDNHVVTLERLNVEERPFEKVWHVEAPGRWHPHKLWHRTLAVGGIGSPRTSSWPPLRSRLRRVARRIEPDIVHIHFGRAAALMQPVADALEIPSVVSFHGFDAFQLPRDSFWGPYIRRGLTVPSAITAVSHLMRNHLIELGAPANRTHVIRVGKPVDTFPYREPDDRPVRQWLSIGRLTEKKGHFDCIEAFGRVVSDFPDASLHIIGRGEEEAALNDLVMRCELHDHVQFLGALPHDEVKQKLAEVDAFVLCSKTAASGDREGVPTVLMEAQAVGLPCVSTHHSGIPEVIPEENQDLLAEEGDVDGIAERMRSVMECSSDQLRCITARGRAKIEQEFNLHREVERLRVCYQHCLEV